MSTRIVQIVAALLVVSVIGGCSKPAAKKTVCPVSPAPAYQNQAPAVSQPEVPAAPQQEMTVPSEKEAPAEAPVTHHKAKKATKAGHLTKAQKAEQARLDKMTKDLCLTKDQQKQIKGILDDERQQITAVAQNSSLDKEQQTTQMKAIHKSTYQQISKVLTPEQKAKQKELAKERQKSQGHKKHTADSNTAKS